MLISYFKHKVDINYDHRIKINTRQMLNGIFDVFLLIQSYLTYKGKIISIGNINAHSGTFKY